MIKQKRTYIAQCDGCGIWFKRAKEYSFKLNLSIGLLRNGWERSGKKWYCPDCQKKN